MRILFLIVAIVLNSWKTLGQGLTDFEKEIMPQFESLKYPVDSVQLIKPKDTLNKKTYNKYLRNKIARKPIYISNGKKEFELEYFGLLPEGGNNILEYDSKGREVRTIFYDRAYPIGRINLHEGYYSLIVKVFSLLSTYYDVHNFTREGKLLSVVPLYYFENAIGMVEKIRVLHVKSSITNDRKIYWWEHYPDRTRERVYILNSDGFFEIISEKITN